MAGASLGTAQSFGPRVGFKLQFLPIVCAGILLLSGAEFAWSQERIGSAPIVINNVESDLPALNKRTVVNGDDVFLNEIVLTGPDSKVHFVLNDNSNVTVGPNSAVKLDGFVYSGSNQPGTVALSITNGTLRFSTGDANKRAYTIWTPTAAVGVRGRSLRIKTTPSETKIINEEGTAIVCLRKKGEYTPVEELRRPCRGREEEQVNLSAGKSCPCTALLLPSQQATVTVGEIAVAAAPLYAVSEPFIGPPKDFRLLAADLPTKKPPPLPAAAPATPFDPVPVAAAILPFAALGLLDGIGNAASSEITPPPQPLSP